MPLTVTGTLVAQTFVSAPAPTVLVFSAHICECAGQPRSALLHAAPETDR